MKINTRLLISQGLLVLLSVIIVFLNIVTFIVSVSHGIADYRKNKDTLENLMQTADQKMYEEKKKIKSNPNYKIIRNM
ncbi:MAG: diguanylate cyclase [Epulopiscium sp.]|nr:diguanylate cyclase [Candidatus Epulonipiscium sp.]